MSEDNKSTLVIPEPTKLETNELQSLKDRATQMGIGFSNNIGVDALKAKIKEKLEGTKEQKEEKNPDTKDETPEDDQYSLPLNMVTDQGALRDRMYKESMYLARVRISNLNPAKKEIPGEFVTVSNKYLGTVRKYIPFGEVTDNGYHIPKILLDVLKRRKFLNIRTRKGPDGNQVISQQWVKEFAIEELPMLTLEELDQLKKQQAAAKGL